jgi:hypothetical protein
MKLKEPYKRHDTCIEFTVAGSPHPTLRWYYRDQVGRGPSSYYRSILYFYR